jgi:hypothetical protein
MPSKHKHPPLAYRPPEDVRERLRAFAERTERRVNAIITEALADYLDRNENREAGVGMGMTAFQYEADILTVDIPGPDLCVRIEGLFPAEAGAGVGQSTLDAHALSVDLAIDAAGAREAEDYAAKLIRDALAAAHVTPGETLAKRLIRWDLFEGLEP